MGKNRKIDIMGIVNLTDDSYFAESRCVDGPAALERIARLLDEGADIVDIGACSTRPGSLPVGPDEEWRRLEPVLKAVRERFPDIVISIDTYWSEVVRRAYGLLGDFIVNDISAGEDDPQMLPTVGELGLTYVAMHKRGTPENMQDCTDYEDVTRSVAEYFEDFAARAAAYGIKNWILDPGFGFAKTVEQNYELLAGLHKLRALGQPLLVGVSRKSMIYKPLAITPDEALAATQALHWEALRQGATLLRVHDVEEAVRTIKLYEEFSKNDKGF